MMAFAKRVARAQEAAIPCKRVGIAVMGLEVPHAHIHLIPITKESDMCFGGKKMTITQDELAAVAALIRKSVQIIGQRLFLLEIIRIFVTTISA